MDTNIQKAFVNGISGCTEHHCKLATIIREATEKHKSLSVCWLDLANAYNIIWKCVTPSNLVCLTPLHLSGSRHSVHLLQYADDTCLVGNGLSSCQDLLTQVERWLQWSGMKAKVPKCYALGIKSSTDKPFDPALTLHNQEIPLIHDKPIKILRYTIQIPIDSNQAKANLHSKALAEHR